MQAAHTTTSSGSCYARREKGQAHTGLATGRAASRPPTKLPNAWTDASAAVQVSMPRMQSRTRCRYAKHRKRMSYNAMLGPVPQRADGGSLRHGAQAGSSQPGAPMQAHAQL